MKKKEIKQGIARLRGRLTTTQSKSMLSILKRANEQVLENPNITDFTIPTDVFLQDIQNKDTAGLGIKPLSNALIVKDFELIQSFRSEYARQLYKHLMMWEDKQSHYLTLKDFKEFLGVPNTKSYERMDVLKRKVINVAIKEINEKCPWMKLEYKNKTKPRSRAIEGFNFSWFKKPIETKGEKKLIEDSLSPDLQKYIGKVFYKEGYDWKILSILKNANVYQVACVCTEDRNYHKNFTISKAQLDVAK